MITREVSRILRDTAEEYNIITILGPRQSGKTTLAKSEFPKHSYANLESLELRKLATEDPKAFFNNFPPPVIIDEIQEVPELLSHIQILSDEIDETESFILTGSHQPRLHEAVTQSLAGRTAILTLLPFSLEELKGYEKSRDWSEWGVSGSYPRLHEKKLKPNRYYRNYFATYVERDLRQMIMIKNLNGFETFIRLLAGRVGQVLNLNSLAGDVGVSSTTLKEWLSVLEASFIVYKLKPYYKNMGKQLVKSPKIYFTDTGLLCYLLGISDSGQLIRDPLRGNIFENLIITEFLKAKFNYEWEGELFHYRDNKGHEVDLILEQGQNLIPVEIKSAMTFTSEFLKGVHYFQKIYENAQQSVLVYNGDLKNETAGCRLINPDEIALLLKQEMSSYD